MLLSDAYLAMREFLFSFWGLVWLIGLAGSALMAFATKDRA